jgi:ribosomal protein S18 acetylase RimI-like enzyme
MGMALADVRLPRPQLELAGVSWCEYLRSFDLPAGLLSRADHNAFELVVARVRGENVASALAFDFGDDRGIYNVTTLEEARRRGLGTAVTLVQVHDAIARGLWTASLQSTKIAERVYASVGFRDLGRILEYVPPERLKPRDASAVPCRSASRPHRRR